MNSEELLKVLEKLLKPILKDSSEVNYGIAQNPKNKTLKDGIEFRYKGNYVRIEIYNK